MQIAFSLTWAGLYARSDETNMIVPLNENLWLFHSNKESSFFLTYITSEAATRGVL